jgi:hypothetical protein
MDGILITILLSTYIIAIAKQVKQSQATADEVSKEIMAEK